MRSLESISIVYPNTSGKMDHLDETVLSPWLGVSLRRLRDTELHSRAIGTSLPPNIFSIRLSYLVQVLTPDTTIDGDLQQTLEGWGLDKDSCIECQLAAVEARTNEESFARRLSGRRWSADTYDGVIKLRYEARCFSLNRETIQADNDSEIPHGDAMST